MHLQRPGTSRTQNIFAVHQPTNRKHDLSLFKEIRLANSVRMEYNQSAFRAKEKDFGGYMLPTCNVKTSMSFSSLYFLKISLEYIISKNIAYGSASCVGNRYYRPPLRCGLVLLMKMINSEHKKETMQYSKRSRSDANFQALGAAVNTKKRQSRTYDYGSCATK